MNETVSKNHILTPGVSFQEASIDRQTQEIDVWKRTLESEDIRSQRAEKRYYRGYEVLKMNVSAQGRKVTDGGFE